MLNTKLYLRLRENLHLVHGNQNSEHSRSQLLEEEGGRWAVALEDFVGCKGVDFLLGHFPALEIGTDLVGVLAKYHGLRLGKVVGEEDRVVVDGSTEVFGNIVV